MDFVEGLTHAAAGIGGAGATAVAFKAIPAIIKALGGKNESDQQVAESKADEDRKAADWAKTKMMESMAYWESKSREMRAELEELQHERADNMMLLAKERIGNEQLKAQVDRLKEKIMELQGGDCERG